MEKISSQLPDAQRFLELQGNFEAALAAPRLTPKMKEEIVPQIAEHKRLEKKGLQDTLGDPQIIAFSSGVRKTLEARFEGDANWKEKMLKVYEPEVSEVPENQEQRKAA